MANLVLDWITSTSRVIRHDVFIGVNKDLTKSAMWGLISGLQN